MITTRKKIFLRSLVIFLVGIGCAVLGVWWSLELQSHQIKNDFARIAGTRSAVVEQRLRTDLEVPEILRQFFASSDFISPEEFATFTVPFFQRTPELQSVSWIAHLKGEVADLPLTYFAQQKGRNKPRPATLREIPGLPETVKRAMMTNQISWINLPSSSAAPQSNDVWWIVLPIRQSAWASVYPETSTTLQNGVLLAQIDLKVLLHSAFDKLEVVGMDAMLSHTAKSVPLALWFSASRTSPYDPVREQSAQRYIYKKTIDLGQEQWKILCRPAPVFLARYEPWGHALVFAGILAFGTLLAAYYLKIRLAEEVLLRRKATLTLLQNVAMRANKATDNTELLTSCLELLSKYLGWPLGHVYLPDEKSRALVSSGIFYTTDAAHFASLIEESRGLSFVAGDGMPGRVLATGQAFFIPDLDGFSDFRRLKAAKKVGIRACFAFPVIVRGRVEAVVEFFNTEITQPFADWEDLFTSIGLQMTHAMERGLVGEEMREKNAVMENVVEGIARVDGHGVYRQVNKAYARLCGLPAEQLIGTHWQQLIHPEDTDRFTAAYLDTVMEGRAQVEGRYLHEGGKVYHQEITMVRDLDRAGKLRGCYLFSRDVTEREEQQAALRESQERFTAFMDNNPASACIRDAASRILYVNKTANEHFGTTMEAGVGKTPEQMTTPEAARQIRLSDEAVLKSNAPVTLIEEIPNRHGEMRHWLVYKFPMQDAAGEKLIGVLCLDVTERQRADEAIIQARDTALESARLKSQFLANMSHEIRTPMNGLIGMLGLLTRTKLDDEQSDLLQTARVASDSLLRLLNDILDFSKIEAGKLEMEAVVFDPRQCQRHSVKIIAEAARKKGLQLTESVADDVPAKLLGDSGRLAQIVINLVSNAVKFTEVGSVSVVLKVDRRLAASLLLLHGIVRDTGIGIPLEQRETIFQPFRQSDNSTARKYGGTGLGLAICSQLVTLMGGKIWVENEPTGGSALHFTVQMEETEEALPKLHPESNVGKLAETPLRILLAEDNAINQRLAIRLLEERGHQVTLAEEGHAAVAFFQKNDFDLILMDVQMPGKDGYEATMEIRQDSRGKTIPIYALTAHALPEDRRRCLDAGMNGYLTKPIQVEEFASVIEKKVELNRQLPMRQELPRPMRTRRLPISSCKLAVPTGEVRQEKTCNLTQLRETVNNDETLIRELTEMFCLQATEDYRQMREALASRDSTLLERSAHRLKGSALSFAAAPLVRAAQMMEASGRTKDFERAQQEWSSFETTFHTLVEELSVLRV